MDVGDVYTRWTVVRAEPRDPAGRKVWLCRCTCGTEKRVHELNLRSGRSKSCGCLRRDPDARKPMPKGDRWVRTARKSYIAMIDRTTRTYHPAYFRYGGAGVGVCDRWRYGDDEKTGWECFRDDMGPRPEGTTLDRIDPHKGYFPENCRWADWKTQGRNRKNTVYLTIGDTTMSLKEWCEHTGTPYGTALYRLRRGKEPLVVMGFKQ